MPPATRRRWNRFSGQARGRRNVKVGGSSPFTSTRASWLLRGEIGVPVASTGVEGTRSRGYCSYLLERHLPGFELEPGSPPLCGDIGNSSPSPSRTLVVAAAIAWALASLMKRAKCRSMLARWSGQTRASVRLPFAVMAISTPRQVLGTSLERYPA